MIRDKLLLKIQNQVSDSKSIDNIDALIDEAIVEASELIKNKDVAKTIRFDVAYYRFLLFVRQNDITQIELKMYESAIGIIKKAPYKEITNKRTAQAIYGKVAQRKTFT